MIFRKLTKLLPMGVVIREGNTFSYKGIDNYAWPKDMTIDMIKQSIEETRECPEDNQDSIWLHK